MENAIVALISTALIILSSVIMMLSTLQSTSKMAASWQAMNTEFNNISATSISAETDAEYFGGAFVIRVPNNGQNNLCDFPMWDVIAQFEDGTATYLTYVPGTTAGNNEWAVAGINIAPGQSEIFDPGILNPEEYLRMEIKLYPELALYASARITVATPVGVKARCMVTKIPPP